MADKPGFGATVGGRSRTAEQPRARRNFSPSGAVCARAGEINSRKKRVAHSRYELPCAALRAHVKETPRCDSKRHDRAAIEVAARVDSERVVRMCGRSSEQPEIGRPTRWHVLSGQNNIPFCRAENTRTNHSKDSYRFDDRLAFLAAMDGTAFTLERQQSKIQNGKSHSTRRRCGDTSLSFDQNRLQTATPDLR